MMQGPGVEFGLSRGLLQMRGGEVLLSETLLESISTAAQLHIQAGKPAIQGNFLVDMTIRAAQDAMRRRPPDLDPAIAPFFEGLNRIMYYTLCRVAERAGLADKEPARLLTNPNFWGEFCYTAMKANIKPGKNVRKIQQALFKVCHEIVKRRYAKTDPGNVRHTDLIALFMFNFWNATGLLPMTQSAVILGAAP